MIISVTTVWVMLNVPRVGNGVASLPRCLVASLPRCLVASLPRCINIKLYDIPSKMVTLNNKCDSL